MYYVEVVLRKDGIKRLVSKEIYKNFRKALSDTISGRLGFGFNYAEVKALGIKWDKPTTVCSISEDDDGYLDDIEFRYGDVLTVIIGRCFIVDEEGCENE